jgi:hypothetical protein
MPKTLSAIDPAALALVLAAANDRREQMDEEANDPRTVDNGEARAKCDALGGAIAILEEALNSSLHV